MIAFATSQLAVELPDVPPGSLYRHVALLVNAGVLQVVAERRVRGALERTYTLRAVAARISQAEAAVMSQEEHAQAFMIYVAGLLADFDRYLTAGRPDPVHDLADYRAAAMWLTDAELLAFLNELRAIAEPRLANAPRKGRRRRMLYTILLPTQPSGGLPQQPRRQGRTTRRRRPR